MVAGKSPDSLPPGWKEHIKFNGGRKFKYYTNAATGKKLYSKKGVVSYVNTTNDSNGTPQPQSTNGNSPQTNNGKESSAQSAIAKEGSESEAQSVGAQTNESPAWLPPGWIMEIKPRKSGLQNQSTYKVYIDPSTGSKFYSKPEVFRYLESLDQSKSKDQRTRSTTTGKSPLKQDVSANKILSQGHSGGSGKEKNSRSKPSAEIVRADVVESSSLAGLSVGWTVEFKTIRHAQGMKIETYYTDPVTGYVFRSERDCLRYLQTGDISQCAIIPKKSDGNDSESTKDINSNIPVEKSYLKKDGPADLALTNGENSKSEKKRNRISKQSTLIVPSDVVEITSPDGLPPGWIKEIKTRRNAHGIRRDPYYTDPISGYMFRSKKDALRYLKTGDVNKCAMKPKKRDEPVPTKENDPEPTKDVNFPSPPVGKRYSLRSSRGQLSGGEELNDGKENCDMSSSPALRDTSTKRKKVDRMLVHAVVSESPALEAESSKRKKTNSVSGDAIGTNSVAEVPGEKQPSRRGRKSRKKAQRSEPESQGSQQDNIVSADNRAASNAGTYNNSDLHGKLTKNTKEQKISRSTPKGSKISGKRIAQSIPSRTSKRLAGSEPEMPANLQLSERSLRAAIKKSCEGEEDILSIITMNGVPSGVPQQLDFERSSATVVQRSLGFERSSETAVQRSLDAELASETAVRRSDEDGRYVSPITNMNTVAEGIHQPFDPEPALGVADIVSMVVESVSKIGSSEKSEEPSAQNRAFPQEKTGGKLRERDSEDSKKQNPQGTYQFLDSWTDPCLDFAFKTLTGAISVDDKLGYQGSSQNQTDTTSSIQHNDYIGRSQNRTDTTTHIQRNANFEQSQNPTDNTTYIQQNENYGQSGSQRLNTYQNGTPSLSLNLGEQHVQAEQFPRAPPSPPPGFTLPLFRGIGSQQRSSDVGSDYQRNTNYK